MLKRGLTHRTILTQGGLQLLTCLFIFGVLLATCVQVWTDQLGRDPWHWNRMFLATKATYTSSIPPHSYN